MPQDLLAVLNEAADAVVAALSDHQDWGLTDAVAWAQYHHDTVADAAAVAVLEGAGLGVFSEESGLHHPERPVLVVVDPVDGSTNASHGLPWWAISLCALDASGAVAAVVDSPRTGERYQAARHEGAERNGERISPSRTRDISNAIIVFNGLPQTYFGWSQCRVLGAAALDLCCVARGGVDGYVDFSSLSLAPWDYLGAMLVCQEAGALVEDAAGRELIVREPGERRSIVAAATPELLEELVAARRQQP
jgi:myo-inositol-1(or 4)-monophosphatase